MYKIVLHCKFNIVTKTKVILMFVFMILCKTSILNEGLSHSGKKLLLKDYSYCVGAQLKVGINPNYPAKTITVIFELTDLRFKDCFNCYKISLKRKHKTVQESLIVCDEEKKYEFKNVTCGFYNVVITPCITDLQCVDFKLYYDANMTSSDCSASETLHRQSNTNIKLEIVIILAVVSIISLLIVSGFIHYYCWSVRCKLEEKRVIYRLVNNPKDKIPCKNIHVYIFYHFNKILKKEVNKILKLQSSYDKFILSVKGIDDELSHIHLSENLWFNKVLKERNSDGSFNKIILINSDMDYEDEKFENENFIFSEIIKRLTDDTSRCCTGYNSLFVAHIGENIIHPERFQNVVRRQRYHIPVHLNELYQNLCSVSE